MKYIMKYNDLFEELMMKEEFKVGNEDMFIISLIENYPNGLLDINIKNPPHDLSKALNIIKKHISDIDYYSILLDSVLSWEIEYKDDKFKISAISNPDYTPLFFIPPTITLNRFNEDNDLMFSFKKTSKDILIIRDFNI